MTFLSPLPPFFLRAVTDTRRNQAQSQVNWAFFFSYVRLAILRLRVRKSPAAVQRVERQFVLNRDVRRSSLWYLS
jgi:hypothetical protein